MPEPTARTLEEVGRLCTAWAYLESRTEQTVWGVLSADQRLGPVITWRLDMRSRWQLILEHAPKKHNETDMKVLRGINKDLTPIARDRNIIVHGMVHAAAHWSGPRPLPTAEIFKDVSDLPFARVPCWTVYRGAEAGKNFPISTDAVELVRNNIQAVAKRITEFNVAHSYTISADLGEAIETDWPKPIG